MYLGRHRLRAPPRAADGWRTRQPTPSLKRTRNLVGAPSSRTTGMPLWAAEEAADLTCAELSEDARSAHTDRRATTARGERARGDKGTEMAGTKLESQARIRPVSWLVGGGEMGKLIQ